MIVHKIIHNKEIINDWYNEGEVIHKMMGGGMVVYQRYKITHQPPVPPTPTPQYRWILVQDEFLCSGTTKCEELKKQVSYDDGETWEDVIPLTYKAGAVIEYDSEDCGYTPEPIIIYRWVNLDPSVDYYCSGTTKMYKQQKQQSSDSGETWSDVVPSEFRMGEPYQIESTDCGYIPPTPEPMYRWVNLDPSTDYYCSGTTKLYKQQEQVSMDSGATWEWVVPAEYREGGVAETESTDCGYVPPTPEPQYRTISGTPYCVSTDKYVDVYSQVSYDSGVTWETTATTETLVERNSEECTCFEPPTTALNKKTYFEYQYELSPIIYRNGNINCSSNVVLTADDINNITKPQEHPHFQYNNIYIGDCVETVSGVSDSWFTVSENNTITTIAHSFNNGVFCKGIAPNLPHLVSLSDSFNDSNITSFTFSNTVESIYQSFERTSIVDLVFPDSVAIISAYAFSSCKELKTIKIGTGITTIGFDSFTYCRALETVEIYATTPPELGVYVFDNSPNLTIYCPDESVDAYKEAWARHADRIKPLSEKP